MSDIIILAGMAVAIGCGVYGVKRATGIFFKIGSVFSALTACVGLAYFGYRPFFGGTQHDVSNYFGCVTLIVSILAWLFFIAISDALSQSGNDKEKQI